MFILTYLYVLITVSSLNNVKCLNKCGLLLSSQEASTFGSFGPSSQTSGAMTHAKELLIKFNAKIIITIVRCRRVDFVFRSHQRPRPEIACSCGNAMMYPAVAVARRVVCTGAPASVKVPRAMVHSRNPGQSFAPGY